MKTDRVKVLLRLFAGVVVLAALCLMVIFVMRGCSPEEGSQVTETSPAYSELPVIDGTDAPAPIETEAGGIVDYSDSEDNSAYGSLGNYANDRVLTYNYGSGSISLGVADLGIQDYLYLNPVCSEAKAEEGRQVGFFITCSSPRLDISGTEGASVREGRNVNAANFVMLDQTYDTAVPAAYEDAENYGVRWEQDVLEVNEDDGGTTLYIRAINLSNGKLLAMCKVTIVYDAFSDTHYLSSLTSSDVVDTGEMSLADKSALVEAAVTFMQGTGNFSPPSEESWTAAMETAKVEHVPAPYFTKFSDSNGQQAKAYHYSNCEIWAVNLQFPTGVITVYFAPQLQIWGFDSATEPGSDDLNLQPLGYACLNPYTKDTILW